MHYILESTFARIILFFRTNPSGGDSRDINLHQFEQFAYIVLLFSSIFVRQWLYSDWPFKTVGAEPENVLKTERYTQRLTHRACMGDASSYSWAPKVTVSS